MDVSRISRSELLAILGGAILAGALFLGWYHLGPRDSLNGVAGPATMTGWAAHHTVRYLLLAAAAAPLILAYIIVRGHALSWPRGELTAVVSVIALGLVAYLSIIDRPGSVRSLTSLRPGVFVALLGILLMLGGSAVRASRSERPRKPPGVV